MTITDVDYFTDATFLQAATALRVLREDGVLKGDPLYRITDTTGDDKSGSGGSDDFMEYTPAGGPPAVYDLARAINATSPYFVTPNAALNAVVVIPAVAAGIPPGAFAGSQCLRLREAASPGTTKMEHKYNEPVGGGADGLKRWELSAAMWWNTAFDTSDQQFAFYSSTGIGGEDVGIGINYKVPSAVFEIYHPSFGTIRLAKVVPTIDIWIQVKMFFDGEYIYFYIFNPETDTEWDLVFVSPPTVEFTFTCYFQLINGTVTTKDHYGDLIFVHTNIAYDSSASLYMKFEQQSTYLGSPTAFWRNSKLIFDSLGTEEGTDKAVLLDIYGRNAGADTLRAAGIIDSPTDLCPILTGHDDDQISLMYRFNNLEEQISPLLSKRELVYQEPPMVFVDDPPGAASADVGAQFIVTLSSEEAITRRLEMQAGGYINCVAGDIGLPMKDDGVSVGYLRTYDNTDKVWWIQSEETIAIGSLMTVTGGTGQGTTNALSKCLLNNPSLAEDIEYYVDWGDGTNSGWTFNNIIPHTYESNSGSPLTLSVTCRDSEGTVSPAVTRAITINDVDPVCVARVSPIVATTSVTEVTGDQTESYEPNSNDSITEYEYDWGDGTTDNEVTDTFTHTYSTAGVYLTAFRCYDGTNWSDYKYVVVTVEDAATPATYDLTDIVDGADRAAALQDVEFACNAEVVNEEVITADWVSYEDLNMKAMLFKFKLVCTGLPGQTIRDNFQTYWENRTILKWEWQSLDYAGNADARYFTGRILTKNHKAPQGKAPEVLTITVIREA